jgi:hypothetical protein
LPSGELLFSDSGNWGGDDGCIYAFAADGTTRIADTTCAAHPNGLAVSRTEGRSPRSSRRCRV